MAEPHAVLKKGLLAIGAALCLLGSSPASADAPSPAEVPQEVRAFAESEGLAKLKEEFQPDPEKFGFADNEEVSRSEVGDGFPMYLVGEGDWEKALEFPLTYGKPLEEWVFLVTADGEVKTYMTVTDKGDRLMVTGLGGRPTDLQGLDNTYTHPLLLHSGRNLHLTESRAEPPSFWDGWLGRVLMLAAVGTLFFWIRNKKIKATDF